MHRLIYTSTASRLLPKDELHKLMNSARRSNADNRITGLLIYHDGCFLQVLEGEKDAVESCFRHIRKDGRHTNFIELASEATTHRLFSAWWMAFREFSELGAFQRKQFVELTGLARSVNAAPMVDDLKVNAIVLAFLSSFRDLEMTA